MPSVAGPIIGMGMICVVPAHRSGDARLRKRNNNYYCYYYYYYYYSYMPHTYNKPIRNKTSTYVNKTHKQYIDNN